MKINTKQFQTKNFRGILSLLAGNTIAKAVVTLGGIVLANYYGPDSYGLYNVFLSYIMILPVLGSFRLDNIMILQKGSTEIRNLFSGILIVSLVSISVLCVLMILLKSLGIFSFRLPYHLLVLTGIGGILTAWNLTQNNLFTKYKLFRQISNSLIIASVFSVVFQAVFYFLNWTETGLIYGWLVGLTASFIYNARVAKGRLLKVDFKLFKETVREHKRIVQFTYPSDSINALANNIMPILVLLYFTQAEVGIYAMAFKILSVPLMLLADSVSRVYFQKAASLQNYQPQALYGLTKKVILPNVAIISGFVLLINTVGIYFLNLFLDSRWESLGAYILALSFWILARSAMNPIAPVVVVINKNHYSLIFNIYLLLVNFISLYIGVIQNDFLLCVWTFSILSGIGYLVLMFKLLNDLKRNVDLQENKF